MTPERFARSAAIALVVFWAGMAEGSPLVEYQGREADGASELRYAYHVTVEKDPPMMEFRVSTRDLDVHHYSDVVKPDGWSFDMAQGVSMGCYGGCTPIGGTALLLKSVTEHSFRWWTDDPKYALGSFTFGFNHAGSARDASWRIVDDKQATFVEDSGAPVGLGAGPVHAPMPDPATLSLLALGGAALAARRRKG